MNGNFDNIQEIVMQEQMLYSFNGGGYAGRVDNIHLNKQGLIVVTDFKTSKKPKKEE
jgi:RecB family exonuclease